MTVKVAITDDHRLFREGIVSMIKDWGEGYKVVLEADNGVDLMRKLEEQDEKPHLIIMDSEMPEMNGAEATAAVKDKYPEIMILALTMLDGRSNFMRMVRAGIDGFLNKNTGPDEVQEAIDRLLHSGHYFKGDQLESLLLILRGEDEEVKKIKSLTEKEIRFIQLASTEMPYKSIAEQMCVSEKTIEGYRSRVFEKLEVKTRVGMVVRALKEGIIQL
jgi:DNA-binding NarL/FixJ family response regulator